MVLDGRRGLCLLYLRGKDCIGGEVFADFASNRVFPLLQLVESVLTAGDMRVNALQLCPNLPHRVCAGLIGDAEVVFHFNLPKFWQAVSTDKCRGGNS
jgi:hypothetical protein